MRLKIFFIIFAALVLSSVLTLELFNIGKIIYGLEIANIKIGGLPQSSALEALTDAENKFLDQKIDLVFKDRIWTVKLKNLGVVLNPRQTIEKAYRLGREKNFLLGVKNQIAARLGLLAIEPDFEIRPSVLEETLKEKLFIIERPAQNATLIYNKSKNDFDIAQPKEGVIIDRAALAEELKKQIVSLTPAAVELSLVKDSPIIFEDGTKEAEKQALAILAAAPFILNFEDKEFKIQKDDLLGLFEFRPVDSPRGKNLDLEISTDELSDFLTALTPTINQSPVNAELTVKDGRAVIFQLAKDGLKLNVEKNIEPVTRLILTREKETELVVEKEPPAINQESIENLGITDFLSAGTSNFSGSSLARMTNIRIGANKFHGVLIKPDEEFSFNTTLGDIGPEQGYLPGLVIKTNKPIPEYGGGICQVSTTMFRTAINAGLKITERFPHAFPVAFYNPQGFDATVYLPHPDLRFINDTPANILIQMKIKGTTLTFEMYGTKDREVKIVGPTEYDKKQDGSMKAKLTQEIYQDGQLSNSKTFYSNYKSPRLFPERKNPLE